MPDITKKLPNGNAVIIREDGSHLEIDPNGEIIGQSPLTLNLLSEAKSFSKGALSGASLGTMGKISPAIPGSVTGLLEEPNPISRKMGQAIGMLLPLLASEATGGATLGMAAARAGAGKFGQAIMSGMGTGMTFGEMKGVAQNLPISQTTKEMATTGLQFAGLGAAGQGLGYLRKVFGERIAEKLANRFINTESKLAEKLREQGKESLGKQYLKTELPGFKNRDEVYNLAGNELFSTEQKIGGRLEANLEQLAKKNEPSASLPFVPQLEYRSTQVLNPTETNPSISFEKPIAKYSETTDKTPANVPRVGGGSMIYNPEELNLQTQGRLFTKGNSRGLFPGNTPEEIAAESEKARELSSFAAEKYGLKNIPSKLAAPVSREGVIDTSEIANSVDKIKKEYQTGTHRSEIESIDELKNSFLEDNPSQLTLPEAMGLKRKLDDRVAKSYQKLTGEKIPISIDIDEQLANTLRNKIYEIDPVIGQFAAQESLMIRIRSGLLHTEDVRKSGASRIVRGLWNSLVSMAEGSPIANVAAKGFNKTMGTPSNYIAPFSRRASRVGVSLPVLTQDQQ